MFHYQTELSEWIKKTQPKTIIETGVWQGHSTRAILASLPRDGILYSIEPNLTWKHLNDIVDTRWRPREGISLVGLPAIWRDSTRPWDVFLHDSDHDPECQTFEYELALWCLKPGGWLLSDDFTWGLPPHNAWPNFLTRNNLTQTGLLGACAMVQKPLDMVRQGSVEEAIERAHALSHKAASDYGDAPRYFL